MVNVHDQYSLSYRITTSFRQEQAVRLVQAGSFCHKDTNSRLARQGGRRDGGSPGNFHRICCDFIGIDLGKWWFCNQKWWFYWNWPGKMMILWDLVGFYEQQW